jgi:glycosyltransferase involved in cell wall biosynthesis
MADQLSVAHRLWRLLPPTARRAALLRAATLLAPKPDAAAPQASRGMVVAGEFSQATGMGEAARQYATGCAAAGFLCAQYGLRAGGKGDAAALPKDAALLLAVNAPSIPLMLAREPKALLAGRRVIGAWAWELPVLPPAWAVGARYVHEAWACSAFTAAALESVLPGRVRVVPYPLAMHPLSPTEGGRADFGLAPDALVVAVVFGLGSSFTRKNPLAAIAAFQQAFGCKADRVLVVKMTGAAAFPAEAAAVQAAAGGAENIKIFTGDWPAAQVEGLIACAEILLSLHRAEGFGLVPAQAMLRGIPVVATGWSGNLQFMDADSAALADSRLVAMRDPTGVYGNIPGAVWAEPDVAHAAALLRQLAEDPAARLALGARGRAKARAALGGAEMRAALAANGITG